MSIDTQEKLVEIDAVLDRMQHYIESIDPDTVDDPRGQLKVVIRAFYSVLGAYDDVSRVSNVAAIIVETLTRITNLTPEQVHEAKTDAIAQVQKQWEATCCNNPETIVTTH